MTRLWWVRHGPTHEKAFVGWRDVPADLSDTAAIARLNAHLPPDALLMSSDLIRAGSHGGCRCRAGTACRMSPICAEFDFGDWDGKRLTKWPKRTPSLPPLSGKSPGDIAPPNGESWNDGLRPGQGAGGTAHDRHAGRDIIIVAHIGVILTQVQRRAEGSTPYRGAVASDRQSVGDRMCL